MDSTRWPFAVSSSPPASERRFPSPSGHSHYESAAHSPEQSLTDSMDHMDMTGAQWQAQSDFAHVSPDNDPPMFSMPTHITSGDLHVNTASSLPISSGARTFSAPIAEPETSGFPFQSPIHPFDLDLSTSTYFTGGILTTANGMYPTSGMNHRIPSFNAHYDMNYVPGFRSDPTMSYQLTQVESPYRPGTLHTTSPLEPTILSPIGPTMELMASPTVKLERSASQGSHDSVVFPPLSPPSSDHAYQASNAATFGSSQNSELLYFSDDSYVVVSPSPERESTSSPVILNATPVRGIPSSPGSDSSQPRKVTTRTTTRRRPSKEKKQADSCGESSYSDEKYTPKSQSREGRKSKKIGGRQKGSHLNAETAEHARKMRSLGSCWVCICQREKCEKLPGQDVCTRCKNRQEKNIMLSNGQLGCNNQKLCTLKSFIVPDVLKWPYRVEATLQFENTQIYSFTSREPLELELSLLYAQLPLRVKLHEYQPRTSQVNIIIKYVLDQETDTYIKHSKQAVPLALAKDDWATEDVTIYEEFLNNIVNDREKLTKFGETCYESFHNDFLRRLFQIFMNYEPDDNKEEALLRDIYKMLLAAHIIGHVSYFPEGQLQKLPNNLANYFETNEHFPTPGLANRQINSIFLRILDKIVKNVLDKLQGILRSSDSRAKWMGAFMCMLGMAMACEEVQSTTDTVGSNQNEVIFGCNEQAARQANDSVDTTFRMMCSLFHMKYKSFTPMRNPDDEEVRRRIGSRSIPTVKKIKELCEEKYFSFLDERRYASPNNQNIAKYYGRQVARFLCDFWTPDSH